MATAHDDDRDISTAFHEVVNMTPSELKKWLDTEESQSVGMTHEGEKVTQPGEHEAVGHEMGRRILALKATNQGDLTQDDYAAMRKVVGYVHRHGKQRPSGDISDTRWRKSLMNWGHDPLKVPPGGHG